MIAAPRSGSDYSWMHNNGPIPRTSADQGRGIPSYTGSVGGASNTSWPGQSQGQMQGRASQINFGPSSNDWMKQMRQSPTTRFGQRPMPNQNPYSNPTPGQNPMMGGGMNFGPSFNPNMIDRTGRIPFQNTGQNILRPTGQPTPNAQGYYGGWQDPSGVRHAGNEPGMSYLL